MKHGWIQVNNGGVQEELAPMTLAEDVYMDTTKTKTVKQALAENFVAVFVHTMSVVNGVRTHNFQGTQNFTGMGRALLTQEIRPGDKVTVNGQIRQAYLGGESFFTLPQGYWVTFVVDGSSVNFNMGGAGVNMCVISVSSTSALPATTPQYTVAVITETPIGKLSVDSKLPAVGAVGDVAFVCSTSCPAPILALRKPSIFIYPNHCYQVVGTEWVKTGLGASDRKAVKARREACAQCAQPEEPAT
jgi:hypothetical protein